MPVQFIIQPKPDMREVRQIEVPHSTGDWKEIYQRTYPFVHSVEIRNLDKTNILYVSDKRPRPEGNNYDPVGPQGGVTEDYDPAYLVASTSSGTITCVVVVKYFSREYMMRMHHGIYEPMSPNAKFKNKLFSYFYDTYKIFGKVIPPEWFRKQYEKENPGDKKDKKEE